MTAGDFKSAFCCQSKKSITRENDTIENKRNYDTLDIFKFISSIFVISIHSNALRNISPLANSLICGGISRLAVPFFFTCSAFFFFKSETTKEKTVSYSKRILKLYLSWFIVMIPITVYERFIANGKPFLTNLLTFVQAIFLSSTFSGSWFLTSCVFCAWLFFFFKKKNIPRAVIAPLCFVVYLFCCFLSGYGNLIEKLGLSGAYEIYRTPFRNPYTSIIVGIPYFALGKLFAEREKNKKPLFSKKVSAVCLFVCTLLLLCEVYFCKKFSLSATTDCYLMLFPCTVFIFSLASESNAKIKKAPVLRKMSTVFYSSHFIWLFCFEALEWVLKVDIASHFKFLGAFVLCFATSEIFFALKKTKHFSWIGNFY
ncbi:MAG: acyltransferase [Clostridia bacterium]|nr:acyltransferase [Clostridia bacterium]